MQSSVIERTEQVTAASQVVRIYVSADRQQRWRVRYK
jgi:hypothetical protein